jgi:hypothetical protein
MVTRSWSLSPPAPLAVTVYVVVRCGRTMPQFGSFSDGRVGGSIRTVVAFETF